MAPKKQRGARQETIQSYKTRQLNELLDECEITQELVDKDCEQSAQTPPAKNCYGSSSLNVLAPNETLLESDVQNYEKRLKKQFIGNKASAKDVQQAALMPGNANAHGTNTYAKCCNYGNNPGPNNRDLMYQTQKDRLDLRSIGRTYRPMIQRHQTMM